METPWWQHLCCTVVTRRVWQPWAPTLTVCDYWNCTDVPALGYSWLLVLLAALFEGGGSLLPAGLILCAISGWLYIQNIQKHNQTKTRTKGKWPAVQFSGCCFAQLNPLLSLLESRLTIWIQLHRVNWHACLKNAESQWDTRSPPLTRLCLQTVAYPTDTGRHSCLIAANRTPCRRNQWAGLQSHTHGLLLPKESAHPCKSLCQCNRTCS